MPILTLVSVEIGPLLSARVIIPFSTINLAFGKFRKVTKSHSGARWEGSAFCRSRRSTDSIRSPNFTFPKCLGPSTFSLAPTSSGSKRATMPMKAVSRVILNCILDTRRYEIGSSIPALLGRPSEGPLPLRFVGCPAAAACQSHLDISQGWASYKPRGRKPRGQKRPEFRSCGYGDLRLPGDATKSARAVLWVFLCSNLRRLAPNDPDVPRMVDHICRPNAMRPSLPQLTRCKASV